MADDLILSKVATLSGMSETLSLSKFIPGVIEDEPVANVFYRFAGEPGSDFRLLGKTTPGNTLKAPFDLQDKTIVLSLISEANSNYSNSADPRKGNQVTFSHQTAPPPPGNLQGRFDGVNVRWSFSAPANPKEIAGYQVRDENGKIVYPFVTDLGFVEEASFSVLRRRVFSVGTNGIVSATSADADFQVPKKLDYLDITNLEFNQKTYTLTKSAANGWDAGARISKQIFSNEIAARVDFAVNETNKGLAFGVSLDKVILHRDQLRFGVFFETDGTFTAISNDATAGATSDALGNYSTDQTYLLEFLTNGTVRVVASEIDIYGRLTENTLHTFTLTTGDVFPLNVGVAVYTTGTLVLPLLSVSGLVDDANRLISPVQNNVGCAYDTATGTVTRKTGAGAKGLSLTKTIPAENSGLYVWKITRNADSTVGLTKSDDDQTETDAEFALKFTYNGLGPTFATAEVWIDGVFDADLGTFADSDEWQLSREGSAIVARKNNELVGSYTGVNLSASDELFLDIAFGGNSPGATVREVKFARSENEKVEGSVVSVKSFLPQARAGRQNVYKIPQFEADTPTANQRLVYNDDSEKFEPQDQTISIGTQIDNSPDEGGVLFVENGLVQSSDLFTFDGANVAIGQSSGTAVVDIAGTGEQLRLTNDAAFFSSFLSDDGNVLFDINGTSPLFQFGKNIEVPQLTVTADAFVTLDLTVTGFTTLNNILRVNAAEVIFSLARGASVPRVSVGGRDDTSWGNNEEIGSYDFYNADANQAGVAARIRSQRGAASGSGAQMSFWTSLSGTTAGALTQQFTIGETGTISGNDKHFILPAIGGSIVTDSTTGIYWHRDSASVGSAIYGIYRTSGAWTASAYQQLKIQFNSGIIIDGGSTFSTRSGTVIQPAAGNVGMGTGTGTIGAKLHVIKNSGDIARFGFDTVSFLSILVATGGVATIKPSGSNPSIKLGSAVTDKIALYGKTPVVQPGALTPQLSQITYGAVTFDYAIQSVTLGGYGFANQNEGDTLVAVVENLQQRCGEMETKLKSLGAFA